MRRFRPGRSSRQAREADWRRCWARSTRFAPWSTPTSSSGGRWRSRAIVWASGGRESSCSIGRATSGWGPGGWIRRAPSWTSTRSCPLSVRAIGRPCVGPSRGVSTSRCSRTARASSTRAGASRIAGRGRVAKTVIRSSQSALGMMFNDVEAAGDTVDEPKQAQLAVLCSMLGTMLDPVRGWRVRCGVPPGSSPSQRLVAATVEMLDRDPGLGTQVDGRRASHQ